MPDLNESVLHFAGTDYTQIFVRKLKRIAVWSGELIAQSLVTAAILFVMSKPEGLIGIDDVFKLCLIILIYFGIAGFVITTALSRLFWNTRRVWTYPLFAPLLFFIHFEILNYVFGGNLLTPALRLVFVIAGMCGTFLTTVPGSFAIEQSEARPQRVGLQTHNAFKYGWGKFVRYEFFALVLSLAVLTAFVISVKGPWVDPLTRRMPQSWRKAVSTAVYKEDFSHDPASHAAMERVVQLYPANTDAWKRRCLWAGTSGDLNKDEWICEKAVEAEPNSPLLLSALGRTQLAAGDACRAEKSYARAISLDGNSTHYADLEMMAQAALKCGDLEQAHASLSKAIAIEEKNRANQKMYSGNDDKAAQVDEEKDKALLEIVQHLEQVKR
jgi:hypothetical protein